MNAAEVFRRFPVDLAYQFGSSVEGRRGPMGDLDLAVCLSPSVNRSEYLKLKVELLRALDPVFPEGPVDLVLLNEAGPLLRHEVLRGGKLLFQRDQDTRIALEKRVMQEYLDTAYLRRLHSRALLARLKDGALGDPTRVYFL